MKQVLGIHAAPEPHWVGDGFPVRSLFTYQGNAMQLSPFLLMDYAEPVAFAPSRHLRGVGEHPHRGFETVTLVYQGELAHQDSTGAGGVIGPGDVQWMTAANGILHQEFHSEQFTAQGGVLETVQLWVNLPARYKRVEHRYQSLAREQIPVVELPGGAGHLRVVAGDFAGQPGPARTYTAMQVWDMALAAGGQVQLPLNEGHTALLVVMHGEVRLNAEHDLAGVQWAALSAAGDGLLVQAHTPAKLLLLSGEPIDEPVVGHGPFVMNTQAEIIQAIDDYRQGRFGSMSHG